MYQMPPPPPPFDIRAAVLAFEDQVREAAAVYLRRRPGEEAVPAVHAPHQVLNHVPDIAPEFWSSVASELEGTGWRLDGDGVAARVVVPVSA